MGFIVMVFSFLFGMAFVAFSIHFYREKQNNYYLLLTLLGILLILFAVYLAV